MDFYYDYTLIDSSDNSEGEINGFSDIDMNSKFIYLKYLKDDHNSLGRVEAILEVALSSNQRIGVDVGRPCRFKNDKWNQYMYDLTRYKVRLFTSLTLINTSFFVSYNKVVSMYDVIHGEWK